MLNKYFLWQLYNIYIDVLIIWEEYTKPLNHMQIHTSFHSVLITPKHAQHIWFPALHSVIILIKTPPEQLSASSSQWPDRNMSIAPWVMVLIICFLSLSNVLAKLQQQIKMHEKHEQTWPHTSISFLSISAWPLFSSMLKMVFGDKQLHSAVRL